MSQDHESHGSKSTAPTQAHPGAGAHMEGQLDPQHLNCFPSMLSLRLWDLNSHEGKFACDADSCISSLWASRFKGSYWSNSTAFYQVIIYEVYLSP